MAEDASAAETAAARALAVEGLKLAQQGNCEEAVPKLERAEKLYHSAIVSSRLGECYVSLGRLVEGTEILRKTLREPLPADPQPTLLKALERAQKTLDAAKPRIAGLTIKVASVADLSVKVDGNAVAGALLDTEIPSDPGEHTVEATAPGFLRASAKVSVTEGERKTVTLSLTRDPNAPAASASSPSSEPASAQPLADEAGSSQAEPSVRSSTGTEQQKPNHTAAYLAWGAGVVGIGVGSALGLMTMSRHEELEGSCAGGVCAPERASELEEAKQLGNFATVGFGVGAAGLVLGTVLYFTAGSSSSDRAGTPSRRVLGLTRPRVAVGPTQVQLGADF